MKKTLFPHIDLRAEPRSGGRARLSRTMGGLRLVALSGVAMALSACGVLGGGAAATAVPAGPTAQPATSVPSAVPQPSPATPAPPAPTQPPATAVPAAEATTIWVGNTDGQGVYVRNTPVMADRSKAYADGTPLTVVGDDVDGDGQHWKHIKTPDGLEGYVPSVYTVEAPA